MLYVIQTVLSVFLIWSLAVAILGTLQMRRQLVLSQSIPVLRYAIVICAHNEEQVIDNLLTCLENQDYDEGNYHIFVLADHCTDRTAAKSRRHSQVTVWERNEGERSGKGAVLNWGFTRIRNYPASFDNVLLFDADNTVNPEFLLNMNRYFEAGAEIVTGKRIAQNPFASLVSQWYTLYWCLVNSLYNKPRFKLGLSSMVSGTGFAFKWNLLSKEGWKTYSLSEDIEFSCQQVMQGHKIDFAEEALFYDEQPTDFHVMVTQLSRWCTGGYQIVRRYFKSWLHLYLQHPTYRLLDLFMVLGFTVIMGLAALFYILLAAGMAYEGTFLYLAGPAVFMYAATSLVGLASAYFDGWPVGRLMRGIITFPIFYITLSLVSLWRLFIPQRRWVNIVHKGGVPKAQIKLKIMR